MYLVSQRNPDAEQFPPEGSVNDVTSIANPWPPKELFECVTKVNFITAVPNSITSLVAATKRESIDGALKFCTINLPWKKNQKAVADTNLAIAIGYLNDSGDLKSVMCMHSGRITGHFT